MQNSNNVIKQKYTSNNKIIRTNVFPFIEEREHDISRIPVTNDISKQIKEQRRKEKEMVKTPKVPMSPQFYKHSNQFQIQNDENQMVKSQTPRNEKSVDERVLKVDGYETDVKLPNLKLHKKQINAAMLKENKKKEYAHEQINNSFKIINQEHNNIMTTNIDYIYENKIERQKLFKLRQFIENSNGFQKLLKPKMDLSCWQDLNHIEPLFCNLINTSYSSNLIIETLPKHSEMTKDFQEIKRKNLKSSVKNYQTYKVLWKFEQFFNKSVNSETKSKYQYTIQNHLENNWEICSKAGLYKNMMKYQRNNRMDLKKSLLPLTFKIIHSDPSNNQWNDFKQHQWAEPEKVWIIKPGQNSNQGNGIKLFNDQDKIMEYTNSVDQVWMAQKQIENPLLIKNRKFDIRIFGLVTSIHGKMKAQLFRHSYIRTNSLDYTLADIESSYIHLSNDAVQARDKENQGKFEDHNKMSVLEFEKEVLFPLTKTQNQYWEVLYPQMRQEFRNLMLGVKSKLDPHRRHHGFELLGFDFMLDADMKLQMIEVNDNPALKTYKCKVLEDSIQGMAKDLNNLTLNRLFFDQDDKAAHKNYDLVQDDETDLKQP